MGSTTAFPLLQQIKIASPCKVAWESMKGDERRRFCNQCEQNVYNIASLTEAEATALIENAEGRLCVRLYRRADGTVLTADCPVGLSAARRRITMAVAAVCSVVVAGFASLAAISYASPGKQVVSANRPDRFMEYYEWFLGFFGQPGPPEPLMGDICVEPPMPEPFAPVPPEVELELPEIEPAPPTVD